MELSAHLDHLTEQGHGVVAAAARAGLDADVPACPEWTVRDLVSHVGQVHRWATSYVATGRDTPPGPGDEPESAPTDDDALLPWFVAGHEALLQSLRLAPADLTCWSFLPAPTPLQFWARRQAHETTIHRVDAESATGGQAAIDADLATDGIDEILSGFFARPRGSLVSDPSRRLAVRTTDTGAAWTMTIGPDSRTTATGADDDADCTVEGDAAAIYLLLWNRGNRDGLTVSGDESLLDLWRDKARIGWR
jgi:uncharacterized protein (TIGR03083 family)